MCSLVCATRKHRSSVWRGYQAEYLYVFRYVCLHVCVYVCMHACIYVYMYVHLPVLIVMHACMRFVCMYVCMYDGVINNRRGGCLYVHALTISVYTCTSTISALCKHTYMNAHTHTLWCEDMHIFRHTYMRTCIHTNRNPDFQALSVRPSVLSRSARNISGIHAYIHPSMCTCTQTCIHTHTDTHTNIHT
jgi:hypothetical protein